MRKTLGALILLTGLIATVLIIVNTSMDVTFGLEGFTERNTGIIQWIVIRLLPVLGFLILILPTGIFYIAKKGLFGKRQRVASVLHWISILLLIIGSLSFFIHPIALGIVLGILSWPIILLFLIGSIILLFSKQN